MLLQIFNLNLLLELLFYLSVVANNNLSRKICCNHNFFFFYFNFSPFQLKWFEHIVPIEPLSN